MKCPYCKPEEEMVPYPIMQGALICPKCGVIDPYPDEEEEEEKLK